MHLFMNDELNNMNYFIFITNYVISAYMCLTMTYIGVCYMMSFMKLIHHYNCDFGGQLHHYYYSVSGHGY